jgi:transcriptional regulator with XRE-family HTH domain
MSADTVSKNRVRSFREKLKLSQRELADLVKTSQQQIQRIESYGQSPRFDLAARIAAELKQPLEAVFPMASVIVEKARQISDLHSFLGSRDFQEGVEQAGFAIQAGVERLAYRLRGGHSGHIDLDRYWSGYAWKALQKRDSEFVVVESLDGYKYAINRRHLLAWQWLYEPLLASQSETGPSEHEDKEEPVRLYLADGGEPLEYHVDEDEAEDTFTAGQLWHIFGMLEMFNPDHEHTQSFLDEDAERVFFYPSEVALFAVPLTTIGNEEGLEYDKGEADADTPARSRPESIPIGSAKSRQSKRSKIAD